MSAEERQRGRLSRVIAPSKDYSLRVGVRKATQNASANMVISATPAAFIVTVARFNGYAPWPENADPSAAVFLMGVFTGVIRLVEDWIRVNISDVRYKESVIEAEEPTE